ncbi:hypothetical protein ANTPLA_LOCUS8669 [Anthophora plagiata]
MEQATEEGLEDGMSRRNWFRRSGGQFSLPLTGNGEVTTSSDTLQRTSLSADAELFGVYSRNRDNACSSIRTVDDDSCCDSQRKISCVASTDTVPDYGGEGDDVGGRSEERVRGTGKHEGEKLAVGQRGAETSVTKERGGGNVKSEDVAACSCEGACGCATVRPTFLLKKRLAVSGHLWPPRRMSTEQHRQRQQQQEEEEEEEEEEEQEEEQEEDEEGGVEGERQGNSRRSRSTIVKLLNGTKGGKWQNGGGSTIASTASSTSCGTLRRSTRKFSVCSRDARLGRTFASIRSIGSYEKLSNGEFETARNSLHASDPVTIGTCGGQRRNYRRYSSCDLESLCEGIKILDGFLAPRGLAVAHTRKQSVTVMLFGTPAHGAMRRGSEEERIREVVRVSRFSLDALSSN